MNDEAQVMKERLNFLMKDVWLVFGDPPKKHYLADLVEALIDAKLKEVFSERCNIEHDWDNDFVSRRCTKCKKVETKY